MAKRENTLINAINYQSKEWLKIKEFDNDFYNDEINIIDNKLELLESKLEDVKKLKTYKLFLR